VAVGAAGAQLALLTLQAQQQEHQH
jgi:hypothetical protein